MVVVEAVDARLNVRPVYTVYDAEHLVFVFAVSYLVIADIIQAKNHGYPHGFTPEVELRGQW